jgi:hypothetical protein
MTDPIHRPEQNAPVPIRGGILPPAVLQDLTDLNCQYLELGLAAGLEGDPRFGWSEPVRRCLVETDPGTRARIATVPFALFGFALFSAGLGTTAPRVEDGRPATVPAGWQARYESFAHQAVFLARQLLGRDPMALQLVLGLSDEVQRRLAETRLAQLAEIAVSPRVIRPRWRLHARFWEMLAMAARRGTPTALQWAHCTGLGLLGAADGDVAPPPPRRRPRR